MASQEPKLTDDANDMTAIRDLCLNLLRGDNRAKIGVRARQDATDWNLDYPRRLLDFRMQPLRKDGLDSVTNQPYGIKSLVPREVRWNLKSGMRILREML